MVVQRAGLLFQGDEGRRAEDAGIGGQDRIREARACLLRGMEELDERLDLGVLHGAAQRLLHEAAHEPRPVGVRIVRHDLELVPPDGFDGQIAEHQALTARRPRVVERPFDLQPLEGDAGLTVLLRQRVVPAGRAGAEETDRVGQNRLAFEQFDFDLADGRFGSDIHVAEFAQLLPLLGVEADRLLRAACGEDGAARLPPALRVLGRGPEGVSAEAQLIPTGDGRAELVEMGLQRLVGARDDAHRLHLTLDRIRRADGHGRGLFKSRNVRRIAEDRESRPFRRAVELGELGGTDERALFARVEASRRGLRSVRLRRHRLMQGIIGGAEVAAHLHMGDIECVPDLVQAVRKAVFREHLFDLEPGGVEEVAQGVLVLVPVHAPPGRTPFAPDMALIDSDERLPERGQKVLARCGSGLCERLRRHLACRDAVVDLDPEIEIGGVVRPKGGRGQVQAAARALLAMADHAVLTEKTLRRRGHDRRGLRVRRIRNAAVSCNRRDQQQHPASHGKQIARQKLARGRNGVSATIFLRIREYVVLAHKVRTFARICSTGSLLRNPFGAILYSL
jgi:hypothetical protein